jgi:hypothetical protein
MMVINVGASAFLTRRIGAVGPIVGSLGAMFIAIWVPGVWRVFIRAPR